MSHQAVNEEDTVRVLPAKITRYQSGVQKCIVNAYCSLQQEAREEKVFVNNTELINRVGKLLKIPSSQVSAIVKKWQGGQDLKTPGKTRKRKSPVTDADSFTCEAIANQIYNSLHKGESLTVKKLHDAIRNDASLDFQGSATSLRRLIKKMGFTWGRGDKYAHIRESEDVCFKRSCFLRKYMKLKEEEFPRPFVFMDETWIYMNGESTKTWLKPGEVKGQPRRPEEGSRLVVVHAGSRDGFVPGAGLIFNTALKTGQDYHGAMNGENFQKWVEQQLVPGLSNLGPCVVVMDNASYHSKVVDPQPTTQWRKNELLAWLQSRDIAVPPSPTVVELRHICRIHHSTFKRFIIDEILELHGHTVLRLPPYHCIFNAIEEVWTEAKHFYSCNMAAQEGSSFERAKRVLQEALNQVTTQKWSNYVDHVEKVIEEYFNKEIRNVPEVNEIVISLADDDDDDDDDGGSDDNEEDPLCFPLE